MLGCPRYTPRPLPKSVCLEMGRAATGTSAHDVAPTARGDGCIARDDSAIGGGGGGGGAGAGSEGNITPLDSTGRALGARGCRGSSPATAAAAANGAATDAGHSGGGLLLLAGRPEKPRWPRETATRGRAAAPATVADAPVGPAPRGRSLPVANPTAAPAAAPADLSAAAPADSPKGATTAVWDGLVDPPGRVPPVVTAGGRRPNPRWPSATGMRGPTTLTAGRGVTGGSSDCNTGSDDGSDSSGGGSGRSCRCGTGVAADVPTCTSAVRVSASRTRRRRRRGGLPAATAQASSSAATVAGGSAWGAASSSAAAAADSSWKAAAMAATAAALAARRGGAERPRPARNRREAMTERRSRAGKTTGDAGSVAGAAGVPPSRARASASRFSRHRLLRP